MAALKLIIGFLMMLAPSPHLLRDIDGTLYGSLEKPSGWKWTLLYFLMSDCPIANQYAPEVQRICASYEAKGVRCFLVYVEPTMKVVDIRSHMKDFKYTRIPAILDRSHDLIDAAGATVVSEVGLFSANGELKYRGRVDNLYAGLGKKRAMATQHDLREALDAINVGKSVKTKDTTVVGCMIQDTSAKK